jgi:transposase
MSHDTAATVAHTIGIDTGKNTLHLIGLDNQGAIILREKIARGRIAARLANVPRCLIGIEAGMATHYVARELSGLGHDVNRPLILTSASVHALLVGWRDQSALCPLCR